MEVQKKRSLYRILGSLSLSVAAGFIFMTILELIIDVKNLHMQRGFFYIDGVPSFILVPFLFVTILLYIMIDDPSRTARIIRSLLSSSIITYVVVIAILVARVGTMMGNLITISALLMIFLSAGFILVELSKQIAVGSSPEPSPAADQARIMSNIKKL
ncbi:hypothetical protein ACFL96_11535 [Thermoproteota archaeon]